MLVELAGLLLQVDEPKRPQSASGVPFACILGQLDEVALVVLEHAPIGGYRGEGLERIVPKPRLMVKKQLRKQVLELLIYRQEFG
eukprot:316533-Pleurochrysis_carterae.AAC.3